MTAVQQSECRDRRVRVEAISNTLVAAARAGDEGACCALYERTAITTYRLVVRIVGRTDAEDVLQQVYLKAFSTIDQFCGQSRIQTWLYRIAVNESLQHLRRGRRKASVPLEFEPMDDAPHHEDSHDEAELLERALARLDPDLRAVFVLREVEQLSYRELAETLHIAEGTVASRLNRARTLLKQHLTELGWEG